jgi:hypothetical protein
MNSMINSLGDAAAARKRTRVRPTIRVGVISMAVALWAGSACPVSAAAPDESTIVVVARKPSVFAAHVVPDAILAAMRGGVQLPNGLNIAIGIDIQTRVDGLLALHTIYQTDGPEAGVRVFTDGASPSLTPPGTITVATAGSDGAPEVTVSRAPTGTTVDISTPAAPTRVNILSGVPSTWLMAIGQTQVPVTENGPAVATAAGDISLASDGRGTVVTLEAPMLRIQQIVGEAAGIIVANTGNDRTIDTISSVNLDLQGFSPELMAGLAMGDQLALAVASAR